MANEMLTGVGGKSRSRIIQGRSRDYGNVLWKQPHLLDLSYAELEEKNLEIKSERLKGAKSEDMQANMLSYLESETGIKAVTVCFTDLEGRLQSLDYDKKFLLGAHGNLTFDGSSISGFSQLSQSDLRLTIDWTSFRWVPSDLFGTGKVLVFGNVCNEDGSYYTSDFRSNLMQLGHELQEKGLVINAAPEIEGFLFAGSKAEQSFDEEKGFELGTMSGYYNSLPQDTLRLFMDKFAEVQRALGFENEKDHPEVAPAQFELNFKYSVALDTADQIQLYKLLAKQVATSMGFTASFLPKPIQNLNGSGMHTNLSISKDGVNMFYDENGDQKLSEPARRFVTGVLHYAKDLCLVMNSSVNSYRRLDPEYEAPNAIKTSPIDRGSMIRIPIGNAKSARVEVRTVAPDCNPYMTIFAIVKAGLKGMNASDEELGAMMDKVYGGETEILPTNIYEALECFDASDFIKDIIGEENQSKYAVLKSNAANRSPKELGAKVKNGEVLYHHDVTNQLLWDNF
jgi:glutamine synthetase